VPNYAPADKEIVLAAVACVHIRFGHSRPEVSCFTPQAELSQEVHIQAHASLEYTAGGSGFARVIPSEKELRALAEMADSATHTDPRRNAQVGKDVQACRRSHEVGSVALRHSIGCCSVQVFVGIEYERDFKREDNNPAFITRRA